MQKLLLGALRVFDLVQCWIQSHLETESLGSLRVNEENDFYKVYVINDNLKVIDGAFELVLYDFKGEKIWEAAAVGEIPENSSLIHFEISKVDFSKFDLKKAVLNVRFNKEFSNYFFVKAKELKLTKPTIQIKQIDDLTIELSTDVLAKYVYLSSENEVFFDDNYFDLLPNEKRIIKISKPLENIKVKSLFDTLK